MTGPEDTAAAARHLRESRITAYDGAWAQIEAYARQMVDDGLRMPEVVGRVAVMQCAAYSGLIPPGLTQAVDHLDLGRFADLPPPQRLVVERGRYAGTTEMLDFDTLWESIASVLDPEVDCLVEFGSGTGRNLAQLALTLRGRDRPLTYIGCEPTDSGRRTFELLFAGSPFRRMSVHFDFAAPQMPFLGGFRRIVAFTNHAIEQAAHLGPGFYEELLHYPVAACVHIEPVGWQRFSNLLPIVLRAHRNPRDRLWFRHNYEYVVEDERLVENAAAWSAMHLYNTDLLRQVADLSDAGRVAIHKLDYDIVGDNPFNPSTRIIWRR